MAGQPTQTAGTLVIRGPLRREDLDGLVARTCAMLEGGRTELRCHVSGVAADAVAADALARLALVARRGGCEVRVVGARPLLRDLIAFVGLADVLRCVDSVPSTAEGR
jgi:ABC-type transporter Mla MlaB component